MTHRTGSITVGALVAVGVVGLAAGGALGWWRRGVIADADAATAASALAACEAQTAPEAVKATAGVVEAVQAPQVAEAETAQVVATGAGAVAEMGMRSLTSGTPSGCDDVVAAVTVYAICAASVQGKGDSAALNCEEAQKATEAPIKQRTPKKEVP